MRTTRIVFLLLTACLAGAQTSKPTGGADMRTIRGWISDESCAHAHASAGKYTGNNPDCVKDCVRKGKRIVVIDPERKMVIPIENQNAAMQNIGDYVEITGNFASDGEMFHVTSLKFLSEGATECERPKLRE
jgi:hypothetical protein